MNSNSNDERHWGEWAELVTERLRRSGYVYDRTFLSDIADSNAVMIAARALGSMFVPAETSPHWPVVLTSPSDRAPEWRPFDRRESIGWHNDFSTRVGRAEVSLSCILRQDPLGPGFGAWRVASVGDVFAKLRCSSDGRKLLDRLSKEAHPFGYLDTGACKFHRIVCQKGLRFYGRALSEGARLAFGQVPDHTMDTIGLIEEAADAVGETFAASRGALLVVHNWVSLHDRTEQTVEGTEARRRAQLCFVKKLDRPLSGTFSPITAGDVREGKRLPNS